MAKTSDIGFDAFWGRLVEKNLSLNRTFRVSMGIDEFKRLLAKAYCDGYYHALDVARAAKEFDASWERGEDPGDFASFFSDLFQGKKYRRVYNKINRVENETKMKENER